MKTYLHLSIVDSIEFENCVKTNNKVTNAYCEE